MKIQTKIKTAFIVGLVLSLVAFGSAMAATAIFIFNPSNTDTGTVNPQVTICNTTLTVSPKNINFGEHFTLTATLNPIVGGATVNFYLGSSVETGVLIGSALTNTLGVATFNYTPTTNGTYTFIALPHI